MNALMTLTLSTTLALALAVPASAATSEGSKPAGPATVSKTANHSLLADAEVFENLAESARTATQSQFRAAMASHGRLSPSVDAALAPGARASFAEIIRALNAGWTKGNRTDVALYSIEAYRLLVQAVSRGSGELPVEVALLDYSGFKLSALAQDISPDWAMIGKTTAEAEKWWRVISPKVRNSDLKQAMQRTIEAYASARRSSNVGLLAYAADMDLILVDAIETDLAQSPAKR